MDRAPVYEAGCSRFDPWRRRSEVVPASSREACHLAVAHQDRAPPSEGGGSTFESCRRGQRPCSSTVEHTFGMGEDWVRSPARALRTRIPTGPPEAAGRVGADAPARLAGGPLRPAVVAQRREQPSSKRPGARSTRAGGTTITSRPAVVAQGQSGRLLSGRAHVRAVPAAHPTLQPCRRGGTATRLAFTQEIAGPTPAGGTSPPAAGCCTMSCGTFPGWLRGKALGC